MKKKRKPPQRIRPMLAGSVPAPLVSAFRDRARADGLTISSALEIAVGRYLSIDAAPRPMT
jgi:hypothetical protein